MFGGYLKQSTAVTIPVGPFVDATDGFTLETALTLVQADFRLSKNGAAFAQKNEATSAAHMENGWYGMLLDVTDTNTLGRLSVGIVETGARQVWREYVVLPANIYDSMVLGSDLLDVSLVQVAGSTTDVAPMATNVATIAAASGSAVSGTADSGTTTTMVDAARTEADVDYWKDAEIEFTSGTIAGQRRLITAFDPATDTITFAPATTQAVGTNTYKITPAARKDVHSWAGTPVATPATAGYPAVTVKVGTGTGEIDTTGGEVKARLTTQGKADVNAEVLDVLNVDTYAEPGQAAPPATASIFVKINYLYKNWRNFKDQTGGLWKIYNDAGTVVDQKASVTNDGTTATKGKIGTGP
jgi:hypothetical protein